MPGAIEVSNACFNCIVVLYALYICPICPGQLCHVHLSLFVLCCFQCEYIPLNISVFILYYSLHTIHIKHN